MDASTLPRRKTIVVTGFGPFKCHTINASWEAVKLLPKICNHGEDFGEDTDLIVKEIEVSYEGVNLVVPKLWEKYHPELMVHVGVSHIATCITIETRANRSGYDSEDVKQCFLSGGISCHGDRESLETKFDAQKIKYLAEKRGVRIDTSDNAHRYLCEYIYYTSLCRDTERTIFLHVPMLSQDYTAQTLALEIKIILEILADQIGINNCKIVENQV